MALALFSDVSLSRILPCVECFIPTLVAHFLPCCLWGVVFRTEGVYLFSGRSRFFIYSDWVVSLFRRPTSVWEANFFLAWRSMPYHFQFFSCSSGFSICPRPFSSCPTVCVEVDEGSQLSGTEDLFLLVMLVLILRFCRGGGTWRR